MHRQSLVVAACAALLLLGGACGEDASSSNPANPGQSNPGDPSNPDSPGDPSNPDNPGDPSNPDNPGGEPGECLDDATFFAERVWQPIMSSRCAGCHQEGGVASGTRMVLRDPSTAEGLAQTLEAIRSVSEVDRDGLSLLVVKPGGLHPDGHGGGDLIQPDSAAWGELIDLASRLRGEDPCAGDEPGGHEVCATPEPGPRLVRRLTHDEYRNTMRDLLGASVNVEEALSADNVVGGFDNDSDALVVSPILADQYRTVAEDVGLSFQVSSAVPCNASSGDRECARKFVARFGLKAFRRPLGSEDKARYLEIFDAVSAEEGFEEGIRWVVTAMLQSPNFLYRTEMGRAEGDTYRLTPWEVAGELSYLFWGTMPDEELLEAAANGTLYQTEMLEAQVERLIADPRSDATLQRFLSRWLQVEQLPFVTRDETLYPELTPAIRDAMAVETARFVAELWSAGASLEDLFTARHSYMNQALASFYGVDLGDEPADPSGFRRVDLSATPYGGLLTQGSVLTTHALPTSSSPIHRGKLVRERFFCQELPPPPANLDTSPPPVDPNQSTRERYTQHASDPACSGCHDLIDPIGFAMENFDAVGRWREMDGVHAIDARGFVTQTAHTNVDFEGVLELGEVLGQSQDVEVCYVEQWLRFGTGLSQGWDQECHVSALHGSFSDDGKRLDGVLKGMTRVPHFLRRLGGNEEGDAPGSEMLPLPGEEGGLAALDPDLDESLDPDPEPGGGDPDPGNPTQGGIEVEYVEQSRWSSGYCADVFVTNGNDTQATWEVTWDVEGTMNNLWNATASGESGRVRFTGVEWNATLEPGQTVGFGFCAML